MVQLLLLLGAEFYTQRSDDSDSVASGAYRHRLLGHVRRLQVSSDRPSHRLSTPKRTYRTQWPGDPDWSVTQIADPVTPSISDVISYHVYYIYMQLYSSNDSKQKIKRNNHRHTKKTNKLTNISKTGCIHAGLPVGFAQGQISQIWHFLIALGLEIFGLAFWHFFGLFGRGWPWPLKFGLIVVLWLYFGFFYTKVPFNTIE